MDYVSSELAFYERQQACDELRHEEEMEQAEEETEEIRREMIKALAALLDALGNPDLPIAYKSDLRAVAEDKLKEAILFAYKDDLEDTGSNTEAWHEMRASFEADILELAYKFNRNKIF